MPPVPRGQSLPARERVLRVAVELGDPAVLHVREDAALPEAELAEGRDDPVAVGAGVVDDVGVEAPPLRRRGPEPRAAAAAPAPPIWMNSRRLDAIFTSRSWERTPLPLYQEAGQRCRVAAWRWVGRSDLRESLFPRGWRRWSETPRRAVSPLLTHRVSTKRYVSLGLRGCLKRSVSSTHWQLVVGSRPAIAARTSQVPGL